MTRDEQERWRELFVYAFCELARREALAQEQYEKDRYRIMRLSFRDLDAQIFRPAKVQKINYDSTGHD